MTKLPLAVDLDGTLILSDLAFSSLRNFVSKYPFKVPLFPFWLLKGRAYTKRRLAENVHIIPGDLTYNQAVIDYINRHKGQGHSVLLVTGSDEKYAKVIADYLGVFDQVLASDGQTNNVSYNKAQLLSNLFGEEGFIYIGNSSQDLAVWQKCAHAVATNAPHWVLRKLQSLGKSFEVI